MARSFNGSSSRIVYSTSITSAAWANGMTLAAIFRPAATGSHGYPLALVTGGGTAVWGLMLLNGTTPRYDINGTGYLPSSFPTVSAGSWYCFVATKAPGTTVARLHLYDYGTNAWTHADSSSTTTLPSTTADTIQIGSNQLLSRFFNGDIATAGAFAQPLNDAACESLAYGLTSWLSADPYAMFVLDQSVASQAVKDWAGRFTGPTDTSTSIATNSVPILSYGHPVIAPTRTAPPPWLNQTSGIAARNGTNSHTIPFGFTSTSGNELVVVVYGGVTHAATGWTEQLQPVSSGELSVFTKTSTGDSSITVTHNASNYPVGWAAYELPAGSSYTSGTGSNLAGTDTLPTLSGLPGTDQLVIAALGRVASSSGITSASAVWSSPALEDTDQFAAYATTDGLFFTVGHQSTSATSVTPAVTPTYGGANTPADRQAIVFAIALGTGGPAPATGTVTAGLPALGSAVSGTAAVTGTAATGLPALTAAITGIVGTDASVAAGLPALSASATGTASASATTAVTLPALQAAASGTASASGTAAASLPALTAAAAGTASATGTAAAILPPITSQASGTASATAAVDVTLPAIGASASGTASASATAAAALPALQAAVIGTVQGATSGGIAATLPALGATAFGTASADSTVTGQLPPLTASASGLASASGSLSGILGALQGSATGSASAAGTLTGGLPALTAAILGDADGTLSGTITVGLPALVAAANGQASATGQINAGLPVLQATLSDAPVYTRRPGILTASTTRSRLTATTARGTTIGG